MKYPFTYLHKGYPNAHPFSGFPSKIFIKIYPFTCSHWEEQNYRVFLKNFLFCKRPLHSFGQRGPKCTPIFGLFLENFLRKNFTLHLFGITKPNDTLFHRKNEKIFFRLQVLYFACQKSPFTYLELECQNATCFREKFLKKNKKICPPEVASKEF